MTSEVMPVITWPFTVRGMTTIAEQTFQRPVGELLRDWRERRQLSQLDLANQVGVGRISNPAEIRASILATVHRRVASTTDPDSDRLESASWRTR